MMIQINTSLSVSYGLGAALWAGFSPMVATALFGSTGTIWSVVIMFAVMAGISAVCTALAPQLRDEDALVADRRERREDRAAGGEVLA